MRNRLTLFAMLALLIFALPASAQSLRQNVWRYGTPISVTNESRRPVIITVVGADVRVILFPGESYEWREGRGVALLRRNTYVTVVAKVCERVERSGITPPAWMGDVSLLGNLTIDEEYLNRNPSEPELKRRVRRIKDELDSQRVLGRKQMKKEADRFFKFAKKHGFRGAVACVGGRASDSYNSNRYRRSYALSVYDTRRGGIEIDGN